MKAITIWQPWASSIALGYKKNETRSWPTNYQIKASGKQGLWNIPDEIMAEAVEN